MKLTRKVLARARENAALTQDARLIVRRQDDMLLDVADDRDAVEAKGWTVVATVHWDGTVDLEREGTKKEKSG